MSEVWSTSSFEAAQVINKAIAYEEAWTAYANYSRTPGGTYEERILAKAHAHQALLIAVRALKERHG